MDEASLPPGFRFHPTDVELACYYLKRKIMGKPLRFEGIMEVELYKFAPWDLPEKSGIQSKDLEWYFYCPGDKKYANGVRKNRATDIGYWKTTGKDRPISYNSQAVAMKKTLVFHLGRAPNGVRTDWVMHEYRLEDKKLADAGFLQDAYVVCRIFKKSGAGPKNGEQYGAPFKDDDWEDDKVDDSSALVPSTASESLNLQQNLSDDSDHILQSDNDPMADVPHHSTEYFNANRLLLELSENNNNNTPVVQGNDGDEIPTVANEATSSVGDGIYDGLEDLSSQLELKSVGDISFSNDMEEYALLHALLELANQAEPKAFYDIHSSEEHILQCNEFGISDGSYMEMKDFLFPVEGQCSDLVTLGSLCEQKSSQSLSSKQIPEFLSDKSFSPSGREDSSGNAGGQHFHDSSVCQTSMGIGSTKSTQSFAGGEQRKLPSESPVTNHGKSHAKLQHLFTSIHGRPALAAEYPSALKEEKLGADISHYRSAIHVNAEVTLQYAFTEDGQLISSNDFLSASSGKQMQSRKIPSRSHSSGSGFAFVFFLGVVSALMWVFVLTLGAKLGKRAWNFFLSW